MRIEWDENKRQTNLKRHGIDFADVWRVFENETATEIDNRFDYGEIRYLTLGLLFDKVIAFVHYDEEKYFREIRD